MGISRNHELDSALSSFARPARLQVQPVRISADLNSGARLGYHIQDSLHLNFDRRPPLNQSPQRMTPYFEQRVLHRIDDPTRHFGFVEFISLMNAGDDDVELLEDMIGVVQSSVAKNIGF